MSEKKRRVPKLRFPGFTDDWEQRKLGEITDSYSGGTPTASKSEYYGGNIPFIRSAEINSDHTELFLTEEGLKSSSAKMVKVGDILYALYGATSGDVGISQLNGAINQAVLDIQPKDGYHSQFIMQWLRHQKQKIVDKYLQGGQGNLSGSIVKDLELLLPSTDEQAKIGECFKNFDRLITLHQRKLKHLKDKKKSLLQKMFPKKGEDFPELRFPGFTDAWEQRKLEKVMDTVTDYVAAGSFADIRDNVAYLNEAGYAQLVRTVDLKKKFTNNDSVYVDENAFKYLWKVNLNEECIVLPNIGANIGEVYYVEPSELPQDNNVLGPNAILLKTDEDTYFVFTSLNNGNFQKQLFENVGSSGQPKFNKTELKAIQLYMPQIKEQERIGQYFRNLDNLITLHQRKLDHLQDLKKALLQSMFV